MNRPIDKIVRHYGSQAALAQAMGVVPSFVHKMLTTGRIPAERCRQLEYLTGGLLSAEQMRPDVFMPYRPK